MALAIACSIAAPAVHAQGNFFVAGQAGRASYDDSEFNDEQAATHAISAGYRWQAGPVTQVGFEVGTGKVEEIGEGYSNPMETSHVGVDTRYRHAGANARFGFGTTRAGRRLSVVG
jgi:hypothetical protein